MMQVPKDTPDKLAALTNLKPLEPVAKCVPKKQLRVKEPENLKVRAPRAHGMASRGSGACTDFMVL
jgi:hypothetical protein